jgi:hypothetical protein
MKRLAGAAVLAALAGSCAGEPAPAAPPEEELHFRSARPLDARYLHLRADGSFRFYFRARFSTTEGLRGTWRRGGPGGAVLRCDRWSRQVVSGPVRVRFGGEWEKQRPRVRGALAELLLKHPGRAAFTRDELEETGTWEEEREVLPGRRERVAVLPISALEESVPRAAVEKVIEALDAYGRAEDPHEVHVRFHRHRSVEFVEWVDWSAYGDPVSVESIRAGLDGLQAGETPADVWVRLSKEDFDRELFGGESFRFYMPPRREK